MDKEIRVLLVEDSAVDAELIARELVKRDLAHILKLVKSKDEFLKALQEFAPDIVLCDYKLPGFIAPEALEILKKSYPETPLIVVSGTIGEDIAVDTMKFGAVDYILKDRLIRLAPAIRRALEEARIASERKRAEEALGKSEERFRIAARSVSDCVWEWDIVKGTLDWFGDIDTILGYEKGEFPRTIDVREKAIHPDDHDRVMAALDRHLLTREPYSEEYRVIKKDGSTAYWIDKGTARWDKNDKAYTMIGAITDITERKKNEETLRESEARYKALFFGAAEGIVVADLETKQFLYANPAICRMFGYTEEELIRLGVADIHPKESLDRVLAEFEAQIRGEKTLAPDLPCLRKDNTLFYADVNAASVVLGSRKCLVGFFTDITERRKASEELKISQNMLLQSEKMASLGRIAADIAHQVNNPLMIISSNAQLSLMSGSVSAELKDALELIIKECSRASGVMHRTLKFAQPSKGEMTETRICESVEAVVSLIEKQFEMARIEIKRNYPEKPVLVSIDNQLMQEVFMNLLNNAKESMPDGGTITITASLEGDFFRIDFKDTGCGMSEEDKYRIFEPFFTTKRKGTGLGLPICYSIVKAHNGKLIFESQLNKGSTATVLLPLRKGKV